MNIFFGGLVYLAEIRIAMQVKHASLFTGIGGFDLAARWMGWTNVFQVEKDKWCQKLLRQNFPECELYGSIEEFNGKIYRGAIDVLTGGFPCQDISIANPNGEGLKGARSGLWYEMFRIVGEIGPRAVVVENVVNLRNMGYEQVQTDLESIGYNVEIFDLPAASVGLSTLERHLWFVATSSRIRSQGGAAQEVQGVLRLPRELPRSYTGELDRWNLPASRVCGVGERIPYRMDRNKALGNAIPPPVAFELFKVLL